MAPYKYRRLDDDTDEIRLLTLLPGEFNDPVHITITRDRLVIPDQRPRQRMSLEELRETLPHGWRAYSTLEGRYIFVDCNNETNTIYSSWRHPDPNFDRSRYEGFEHELDTMYEPQYEALSYAWGSSNPPKTVYIDEAMSDGQCSSTVKAGKNLFSALRHLRHKVSPRSSTIKAGTNLLSALRHLRYEDSPRTLWVDAICINQGDEEEVNEQVKRNRNIYRLASRVVVWLGPEADKSTLALSTLSHIGAQTEYSKDNRMFPAPHCKERDWYHSKTPLPFSDETWQAPLDLLARPWFERLWVVQEIRLANRDAIVQCGWNQITWYLFRRAILCLHNKALLPTLARDMVSRAVELAYSDMTFNTEGLLYLGWSKKNSFLHDKVYGVLSMAPEGYASRIHPDYSKSVATVYTDSFFADVKATRRLELLPHCCLESRLDGMPSWVPNWSVRSRYATSFLSQIASGLSAANAQYLIPATLGASGVLCATVTSASEPAPQDSDQMEEFILGLLDDLNIDSTDITSHEDFAALAHILTSGYLRERYPYISAYPTLAEAQDALLHCFREDQTTSNHLLQSLDLSYVRGRTVLKTKEGYLGSGPECAQSGDRVCALLGCSQPILLRPTNEGSSLVVGSCYFHGLGDTEALLGPLPHPWTVHMHTSARVLRLPHFFNSDTGLYSDDDPRLDRLPLEWERIDDKQTADDPIYTAWHRNTVTGEEINSDPRMLPEALKARGVRLQTFKLI